MKTMIKKLFLLAIIFFIPNIVQAAGSCSYSEQAELNDIVANVKANYEVIEIVDGKAADPDHDEEFDYYVKAFKISILNITNDIYVRVTNDANNDEFVFYSKDTKDGIVSFEAKEKERMVTYTFEVYSNKYACAGEQFRKFTIMTPIFNHYSTTAACEGHSDFYYCQEFITTPNIGIEEFDNKYFEYLNTQGNEQLEEEKKNKSFFEKIKEFYNDNKLVINIVSGVVIASGVATTLILVKKKRSRVL